MIWDTIIVFSFICCGFTSYTVGVFVGENKKRENEKGGQEHPPKLPWNAGILSRTLYFNRMRDHIAMDGHFISARNNRLSSWKQEAELDGVLLNNEKEHLENEDLRLDIEEKKDWEDRQS